VIRTPRRGMSIAGLALGSVGLAVGAIGPMADASAQPVGPVVGAQTVAVAAHDPARHDEVAAQRQVVSSQLATVAAMAGATAIAPPAPKKPRSAKLRTHQTPHQMALAMVTTRGWSKAQFSCLDKLWTRESNWNAHENNGGSGAYGIPQSLPGRKMASFGRDWRDNPMTQIKWGLWYISNRYGTPCAAWAHSEQHNWY
jgi:resuscitation-promoting factor RpfB